MKAKIFFKKLGIVLASIIGVIAVIIIIANITVHITHHDFYKLKTNIASNPGVLDNYVPQGIAFNTDENYYATCGYMKKHEPSRIYTVNKDTKVQTIYELTSDGEPWNGHTGGLSYSNGKFYLASEKDGVFVFDASLLENNTKKSKQIKTLEIGKPVIVNNNSSFCSTDDKYLYVGEFAHVPAYPCVHDVTYNGKTNTAIMTKYALNNLSKPLAVYSIPDDVQGCVFTDDGYAITSKSWALTYAAYDVYSPETIVKTDLTMDGAPVYFFTEYSKRISSIFFTEDVAIVGDKMITMTEGGANKYYTGKFLNDYGIYQFNLEDLKK